MPARTPYFFDLPVSDLPIQICNALRVMYHGSLDGAFGSKLNDHVDLDQTQAIKIRAWHRTKRPLSPDFEYNLVFYRKDLAASLWDLESRDQQAALRDLTRRVRLNAQPSLVSRRLLDNLFIRSEKPVYFVRYEEGVESDHCVPAEYHEQLFREFEPYLMRTGRDFPLVRSLFAAQGLELAERRLVSRPNDRFNHVITYTLESVPTIGRGLSPQVAALT